MLKSGCVLGVDFKIQLGTNILITFINFIMHVILNYSGTHLLILENEAHPQPSQINNING